MIDFKPYLKDLIEKPKDEAIRIVLPIKNICNCNCHSGKPPYKKDLHYDGLEKKDKPCVCGLGGKYKIKKGQEIELENKEGFWYAGIPAQKVTKIKLKILILTIKRIPDFTEEEIKGHTIVLGSAMESVMEIEMLNAPEDRRYRQGLALYAAMILGVKDDNRLAVIEIK